MHRPLRALPALVLLGLVAFFFLRIRTAKTADSAFVQNETATTTSTASSIVSSAPQGPLYAVTDVVDGDTIKINMSGTSETLRLIGMDTPEIVDPRKPVQCFAQEASSEGKALLTGREVRIETDPSQGERDKYGRMLAYVFRDDGLFYNEYMIAQGYAHEYTYDLPYKYQSDFKAAQNAARQAQLGLWSPETCNGDTATPAAASQSAVVSAGGKYYTSSYHSAEYYYPAACDAWRSLNQAYVESFDTLDALLSAYPSRVESPDCK